MRTSRGSLTEASRLAREREDARRGVDPYRALSRVSDAGIMEPPEVLEVLEEDPGAVFVFDVETTGLSSVADDVLELSIINGAGRTVHTSRYSAWTRGWPEAQAVHGIRPEDVEGLPRFESDAAKISGLLRRARVLVGYNVLFDLDFMAEAGVVFPAVPTCDVMEEFAQVYGEWADWIGPCGGWKWQKLTTAGRYYGVDVKGAHGSLRDCQITLEVLKRISKEPECKRRREDPKGEK